MNGERETSELASFHPKPYGCTAWPARPAPPPPGGSSRRSHGEEDSCWVMALPGYAVNHSPPAFGSVCVCNARVRLCEWSVRVCAREREYRHGHLSNLTWKDSLNQDHFFLSYFDVLLWMTFLRFFFFFFWVPFCVFKYIFGSIFVISFYYRIVNIFNTELFWALVTCSIVLACTIDNHPSF